MQDLLRSIIGAVMEADLLRPINKVGRALLDDRRIPVARAEYLAGTGRTVLDSSME